jgi:hypothetical protein
LDLDEADNEIDSWAAITEAALAGLEPSTARVCVDISGFMRPYIALLPLVFAKLHYPRVSVIYTDPLTYQSGANTEFTKGAVDHVSQVPGCEGVHDTSTNTAEVLIIGTGYDYALVRSVAESRRAARHLVLLGLPSLQPHMYQESQLNLYQADDNTNYSSRSFLYAPANDPFMTADIISKEVTRQRHARADLNVYLAPVGPKAHVLGFGWYYLCEQVNSATSIVFPYAPRYSRGSATGVSRIHRYELEMSWVPAFR